MLPLQYALRQHGGATNRCGLMMTLNADFRLKTDGTFRNQESAHSQQYGHHQTMYSFETGNLPKRENNWQNGITDEEIDAIAASSCLLHLHPHSSSPSPSIQAVCPSALHFRFAFDAHSYWGTGFSCGV